MKSKILKYRLIIVKLFTIEYIIENIDNLLMFEKLTKCYEPLQKLRVRLRPC